MISACVCWCAMPVSVRVRDGVFLWGGWTPQTSPLMFPQMWRTANITTLTDVATCEWRHDQPRCSVAEKNQGISRRSPQICEMGCRCMCWYYSEVRGSLIFSFFRNPNKRRRDAKSVMKESCVGMKLYSVLRSSSSCLCLPQLVSTASKYFVLR